jgi:hypothetical protein
MHPHPSTLEAGFMFLFMGAVWLLLAKAFIATWGDEARMLKNPTFAFSTVQQLKWHRVLTLWIARWIIRPAAWVMLVVGASMFLAGLIRSAPASAPGV